MNDVGLASAPQPQASMDTLGPRQRPRSDPGQPVSAALVCEVGHVPEGLVDDRIPRTGRPVPAGETDFIALVSQERCQVARVLQMVSGTVVVI